MRMPKNKTRRILEMGGVLGLQGLKKLPSMFRRLSAIRLTILRSKFPPQLPLQHVTLKLQNPLGWLLRQMFSSPSALKPVHPLFWKKRILHWVGRGP